MKSLASMPSRLAALNPARPRRFVWPAAATLWLAVVLAFAAGATVALYVTDWQSRAATVELAIVRAELNRIRSEPQERTVCRVGRNGVTGCIRILKGDQ